MDQVSVMNLRLFDAPRRNIPCWSLSSGLDVKSKHTNACTQKKVTHQVPSVKLCNVGAQWLGGRVLDSRPRGRGFEPHRRRCVVAIEQDTFILA